jgi:Amidohydrolase family
MKGAMVPGQLADLAVLSADYFAIPEEEIKRLESVLTIVGGHIVYATDAFATLAPPPLPVSPDWSPVKHYGGYASTRAEHAPGVKANRRAHTPESRSGHGHRWVMGPSGLWRLGCDCFAI